MSTLLRQIPPAWAQLQRLEWPVPAHALRKALLALDPAEVAGAAVATAPAFWHSVPVALPSLALGALAAVRLSGKPVADLAFGAAHAAEGILSDWVPLRVAGEVRYTDGAFSDTVRPAAYIVSELAPVPLPYGARLEAYGQAGWVGGPDPTGLLTGRRA